MASHAHNYYIRGVLVDTKHYTPQFKVFSRFLSNGNIHSAFGEDAKTLSISNEIIDKQLSADHTKSHACACSHRTHTQQQQLVVAMVYTHSLHLKIY